MKKFIICLLILLSVTVVSYAEQDITPKDLKFETTPGKYIYSNNPEFITRDLLADYSNPNPTFLMSNKNMGKETYAMFISHINHTKILKDAYTIKEPGFEVEVDVLFEAQEDTEITFTAIGFEVPENKYYYMNGQRHSYEDRWECLNAWSDYLGLPLFQVESGKKSYPKNTEDITVTIKKGERFWMSSIIPGYRSVPFFRPVHLISDFEIKSGLCDIHVAALKSNGSIGDRSNFSEYTTFAKYIKDRQYKGVADSSNLVKCELNYTINHTVYDKTKLPVMVYNQHAPETGNYTQTWVSHINPKANIPTQFHVVETDMLKFRYVDDNKLTYYGSSVPDSQKDNIWYFDTLHSDSSVYPGQSCGVRKSRYIPNYEIPKDKTDYTTCNLGNYGVREQYKVNIKNEGWTTRYINYNLYTESNVIVILRDENGNPSMPYGLCKGATAAKEDDVILSIPLPPQQTTSFIIEVILPTNCVGAIMNSLEIANSRTNVMVYNPSVTEYSKDYGFTGQEFTKWVNRELYTSTDLVNWIKQSLNQKTKDIFEGTWNEFEFLKIPGGYMAKATLYDGVPYALAQDFYKTVYFLDDSFNLKHGSEFGYYPSYMSYSGGMYYVYAGGCYASADGKQWELTGDNNPFPVCNGSEFSVKMSNGHIEVSNSGYLPVVYEGTQPQYIDALGDTYFYADGNKLYTSKNGIYWNCTEFTDRISSVYKIGDKFTVNKQETKAVSIPSAPVIKTNDRYLGFDVLPEISAEGVTYVPLRFLAENMGAEVIWNENDHSVTLKLNEKTTTIPENSGYIKQDKMMIPLRYACEQLGFEVIWENGIITLFV